jgi:nucleoside-diphosphate-sugar epimerase
VNVLVTGSSGFIGKHLLRELQIHGNSVRVLARPGSKLENTDGVINVSGRLEEYDVASAADGCSVVYHLAGLTRAPNEAEFTLANAVGTHEAARGAQTAGARFVYVSSQAAAGTGTLEQPRKASDEPKPLSPYGKSKLEGERLTRKVAGLEYVIVRPSGVYGPGDKDFLFAFQAAAKGFFPVLGNPSRGITLIHVRDLVNAIILAGEHAGAVGNTYFAGHPKPTTWAGILEAAGQSVGRKPRFVQIPNAALWAAANTGELAGIIGRVGLINRSRALELTAEGWVCDVAPLEALGWQASVDLEPGFLETADWYRSQKWL